MDNRWTYMSWQEQENEYAISFPHIAFNIMERIQKEEDEEYENYEQEYWDEVSAHHEIHHYIPEKQPKWLVDVNRIIDLLD